MQNGSDKDLTFVRLQHLRFLVVKRSFLSDLLHVLHDPHRGSRRQIRRCVRTRSLARVGKSAHFWLQGSEHVDRASRVRRVLLWQPARSAVCAARARHAWRGHHYFRHVSVTLPARLREMRADCERACRTITKNHIQEKKEWQNGESATLKSSCLSTLCCRAILRRVPARVDAVSEAHPTACAKGDSIGTVAPIFSRAHTHSYPGRTDSLGREDAGVVVPRGAGFGAPASCYPSMLDCSNPLALYRK
jgi:hypothetical protein